MMVCQRNVRKCQEETLGKLDYLIKHSVSVRRCCSMKLKSLLRFQRILASRNLSTVTKPYPDISQSKTSFSPALETSSLAQDIHQHLSCEPSDLDVMAKYYFDGKGKSMRPSVTLAMASAVNSHLEKDCSRIGELQKSIAMIGEMFHTSSLVHDDVIDRAESRRGKESICSKWNTSKSIHSGVYILGISKMLLAQTGNPEVISTMSQILTDLVCGEFQQMSARFLRRISLRI